MKKRSIKLLISAALGRNARLRLPFRFSLASLILLLPLGCAGIADKLASPQITSQSRQTVTQKENYSGPRVTVAVLDFPVKSGAAFKIGGDTITATDSIKEEVSAGMQDMIVTALVQTGKFKVLERERLAAIVQENQIKKEGAINVENAKYLIAGAITGYEASQATIGGSIGQNAWGGFLQGGIGGAFLGAAWGMAKKGVSAAISQDFIMIDARIISAETGEIVWTTSLRATPKDLSGNLGGMFGNVLLGLSGSYKTPISKAQRALAIMLTNALAKQAFSHSDD
jgi:curli biogenesis system outer membrane secretion channel CsgG